MAEWFILRDIVLYLCAFSNTFPFAVDSSVQHLTIAFYICFPDTFYGICFINDIVLWSVWITCIFIHNFCLSDKRHLYFMVKVISFQGFHGKSCDDAVLWHSGLFLLASNSRIYTASGKEPKYSMHNFCKFKCIFITFGTATSAAQTANSQTKFINFRKNVIDSNFPNLSNF